MLMLSEKTRGGLRGISIPALQRFLTLAQESAGISGEVTVLLTSDDAMRLLNRSFRGKNAATDVLSFPAARKDGYAGDIAISLQAARQQARDRGHSAGDEIKILMLHGMLHLAGMDHERDHGQMGRMELRLRSALGLPEALISRGKAPSGDAKKRRTGSARSRKR